MISLPPTSDLIGLTHLWARNLNDMTVSETKSLEDLRFCTNSPDAVWRCQHLYLRMLMIFCPCQSLKTVRNFRKDGGRCISIEPWCIKEGHVSITPTQAVLPRPLFLCRKPAIWNVIDGLPIYHEAVVRCGQRENAVGWKDPEGCEWDHRKFVWRCHGDEYFLVIQN